MSGWHYTGDPEPDRDARKLVTLHESGMYWVGIRAWHFQGRYWMNNGEPEKANVIAWMTLPSAAPGRWDRGKLTLDVEASAKPGGQ